MMKARYRIAECDVDEKTGYTVVRQDGTDAGEVELIGTEEGNEVWLYVNGGHVTLPLTKKQATKLCASLNKVKHFRCANCGDEHPETEMIFEGDEEAGEIETPFCGENCMWAYHDNMTAEQEHEYLMKIVQSTPAEELPANILDRVERDPLRLRRIR